MAEGIDYSYGSGLTAAQMKAGGKHFAARYLATLPNSKCINKTEFTNLIKAGISVVLVWETTADRVLSGSGGGSADAREADRQARGLGAPGIPIYFACDIDSTPGQQGAINGYCDGVASVIGRGRTGLYGGYWPVKRAFDSGKIHYGWQTYAWSGGNLDRRAQLYQYRNGVRFGPAEVDFDRSMATDYGQWPRPHGTAAAAVAKPAAKAKAVPPMHPARTDGHTSLGTYAHSVGRRTHGWVTAQIEADIEDANALLRDAVPPAGRKLHW